MEFIAFLGILFIPFMFLFLLVIIPIAFWIWMIVDAVQNEKKDELTMWLLILILGNWIGAIIYYFVRKRKRSVINIQNVQTSNHVSN